LFFLTQVLFIRYSRLEVCSIHALYFTAAIG